MGERIYPNRYGVCGIAFCCECSDRSRVQAERESSELTWKAKAVMCSAYSVSGDMHLEGTAQEDGELQPKLKLWLRI